MNIIMTFVFGYIIYYFVVFAMKSMTYPRPAQHRMPFSKDYWITMIVSPDFWFANTFKNRIKQFVPNEEVQPSLKEYIKSNNSWNLLLSSILFLLLIAHHSDQTSTIYSILLSMAMVRYVSRSYEITYAFGKDVLQPNLTLSGLDKFERIKLALLSYTEIFIYSASAYLVLPAVREPIDALSMSLNVGSLTNVGFAFGQDASFFHNMVFVQVFCTLSLVALSLASYLSRTEEMPND
jgi:hypothetical protein